MKACLIFLFSTAVSIGYCQHDHKCKWHRDGLPLNSSVKSSENDNKRSDTINVLTYDIYLDFSNAGTQTVAGNCSITFHPKQNGISRINLDLLELTVDSITQNDTLVTYGYNDTLITANLLSTLNTTDTATVVVYYHGSPQQDASGWGGFYFQGSYAYNLGVGFSADPHNYGRVWHPCFDNFKERAKYNFEILTTNGNTSYCNGYITGEQTNGDTLVRTWSIDEPIPSYLANVAVGPYTHARVDHTSIISGSNIPVWLISSASDTSTFKNAFQNLDDAIDIYETSYGAFKWNKVGFVAVPFSSGAMEHTTNICYPQAVLGAGTAYETLMAHELSHQWWGNYVTTESESEMWINEGIAVYSEHLFLEGKYGYSSYINKVKSNHKNVLLNAHVNDDGHYALSNVPPQYTYGDHSYKKGADVMHTLRTVMGDSNFFTGLQGIQLNRAHKTINSVQFRDELNTTSTTDVTDFFDDWVMQPGFPQFSIDSFAVTPNGSDFDVIVYTKQRLRAAPSYCSNVPFQVTFMDENWNKASGQVILSGMLDSSILTIPFHPTVAFLNENDKINQAVTGENSVFNAVSNLNLDYSEIRPFIDALDDSVFLRTEHNYVAPDGFLNPNGWNAQYTLSEERYWSVHGIFGNNFRGKLRMFYKGQTPGSLDYELFNDGGTGVFHEDSIRLFYRRGAGYEWTVLENATVQIAGNPIDGYGYITTDTLLPGEYTFGWISGPVGVEEMYPSRNIRVYPNPSANTVWIDLLDEEIANYSLRLYDLNGKLVRSKTTCSAICAMDLTGIKSGAYLLSIMDQGKFIMTEKVIIR